MQVGSGGSRLANDQSLAKHNFTNCCQSGGELLKFTTKEVNRKVLGWDIATGREARANQI